MTTSAHDQPVQNDTIKEEQESEGSMVSVSDIKAIIDSLMACSDMDTRSKLAQISAAYFETVSTNFDLVDENRRLKAELEKKKKLQVRGGAYYIEEDDSETVGPICPDCYKDDIIVLLESVSHGSRYSKCSSRYAGVKSSNPGQTQKIG